MLLWPQCEDIDAYSPDTPWIEVFNEGDLLIVVGDIGVGLESSSQAKESRVVWVGMCIKSKMLTVCYKKMATCGKFHVYMFTLKK